MKIWHRLKQWVESCNFNDPDLNLTAFFVQLVALVIMGVSAVVGLTYALAQRFDYLGMMALNIASLALVRYLVRHKRLQPAIYLLVLLCLALLVIGVMVGGGIHAASSAIFPVLLLFSSVLLGRRAFIYYTGLCVASVGLIILAEALHLTPPYQPDPPELPLFIVFTLILVTTAVFGRFLTEKMVSNLRQTRQHEQELAAQTEQLQQARREVLDLNLRLEQRVAQRTSELESVVGELESFSYTVGHDLRAPLRHIHGYSKMLLEDCGELLPEKSLDDLSRIENAAKVMGEMVDALLAFSRLARSPIERVETNLSELANAAAQQLRERHPSQSIQFEITPGLTAQADPKLMQILLLELLENAVKFSSKTACACIEVGVQTQSDSPIYYIRDNGVGFDMAYVHKLFQPFQRLHHASEFPGTGAGLVTAQRIIHRHGGRIWAEGRLNLGTVIYFTLG